MPKCIVINIEDPKAKKFYVCVNGHAYEGETDVELNLDEKFIGALENAVVDTMVPTGERVGKLGEVVKVRKIEHRFRIVRLESKAKAEDIIVGEVEPVIKKKAGNPNWGKKKEVVEDEAKDNELLKCAL